MHRIKLLKQLEKEQKVPEEEYVEMVRKKMQKVIRLSEAECSGLTFEDLDSIDRSRNYVLPNAYKRKLEEYRKVYRIITPEEEQKELEDSIREQRWAAAKREYDENRNQNK